MMRALLEVSGRSGYREMTVSAVVERSGSNRERFYSTFGGKAEAYATAYSEAADELVARLLRGCDERDWTARIGAGLIELTAFVDDQRDLAAGLIAEAHVAGGEAMAKRLEVLDRLAGAIDATRGEIGDTGPSPPPITATFIVTAIEAALIRVLGSGSSATEQLPALLYLAVAVYLGPEPAARAMEELGSTGRAAADTEERTDPDGRDREKTERSQEILGAKDDA